MMALCSIKFKYPFFVKTTERLFELYASTTEERTMWIAGFNYVIVSTNEVQDIMKRNNDDLSAKLQD